MTVWIVEIDWGYDGSQVLGAWSSRDAAFAAAKDYGCTDYIITPVPLDSLDGRVATAAEYITVRRDK